MKKTKHLTILFLGLLLFLPIVKVSLAQESYVGIQNGDEYLWRLSLYQENWGGYFNDEIEWPILNLFPLGQLSLYNVYSNWIFFRDDPKPQSYWPITDITIGTEEIGTLLFPFDNTTIRSTPVSAIAGWELVSNTFKNFKYPQTWYIANETSSFLRQTLNLTLAFSPYGIMSTPFAPLNVDWTLFVTEFLEVMNLRGGLYKNISATAQSNGYLLHVPPQGFGINTVAIDIQVSYNSKGVLSDYEFIYGGRKLVKYWSYVVQVIISKVDVLSIMWGGIIIITIVSVVFLTKRMLKKPIYIGV